MAYELTQNQEDEENKDGQQGAGAPVQSGGSLISGGAGESGLAGGGKDASAPANPYSNVKDFLDANVQQAQGLASKIGNRITTEGSNVRGAIDTTKGQFTNTVGQNTVGLNRGLVDQAKNQSANFVQDKNNVGAFQKMRDAQYKGPTDFTDYNGNAYAGLQSQAKNVMDRGNLVDSESGRQTLVSEVSRRPTAGKSALDSMLINQNPQALDTLKSAKGQVSTLQSYLDEVNALARNESSQAKSTTDTTRQTIQDEFLGDQGAIAGLKNTVNQRVGDLRNQAGSINAGGLAAVKNADSKSVSDAQLSALGLSRDDLQILGEKNALLSGNYKKSALDLNSYASSLNPEGEIYEGNVQTKDEVARAKALAELMGTDSVLRDSGKEGTVSTDLLDFKKDSAVKNITDALTQAEMDRAINDIGGLYYQGIGANTGAGTAGGFNGRDTAALVKDILEKNRDMNADEMRRFFGDYIKDTSQIDPKNPGYIDPLNDQRIKARDEFLSKLNFAKQKYQQNKAWAPNPVQDLKSK